MHFLLTIILAAVMTALGGTVAHADKRVALVIGNSGYKNVARLKNPVNDAAAVVAMFKKAGFDTVDSRLDLSVVEMRRALREFGNKARDADVAVKLDVKVASIDALEAVKTRTGRVCPLDCERGTRASGDRCVKITCDGDEVLGSNGTCRPKPERTPKVVTHQERRAPAAAGGRGRCFAFNGRQVCE